ncbi:MAG: DUF4157 domain-containing protein [Gemmataceae bacterium]
MNRWACIAWMGLLISGSLYADPPLESPKPAQTESGEEENTPATVGWETPRIPAAWDDLAFNRYVNVRLLSRAMQTKDASMLVDIAFQFAEGERVLGRPHKAIVAKDLMMVAARWAGESQDTAALDRLGKYAKAKSDSDLEALVNAGRTLAKEKRSADPDLEGPGVSSESFHTFHVLSGAILEAHESGDKELLRTIAGMLPLKEELNAAQRKHLKAAIDTPPPSAEMPETLRQLAASSRGLNIPCITCGGIGLIPAPPFKCSRCGGKGVIPAVTAKPKAEDLWGEAGRVGYPAAKAAMTKRAQASLLAVEPLPMPERTVLKALFGNITDAVTIVWGQPPLDDWTSSGFSAKSDTEAQTFGTRIFFRYRRNEVDLKYQLKLLIHEMTHVEQNMRFGSEGQFGYQYFRGYYRGGLAYARNPLEIEAFAKADQLIDRAWEHYKLLTAKGGTPGSYVMVAPGMPLALVVNGKRIQWATSVGADFTTDRRNYTVAQYQQVPALAEIRQGARVVAAPGLPAAFVSADGTYIFPVDDIGPIARNGSSITPISAQQYGRYKVGPSLLVLR